MSSQQPTQPTQPTMRQRQAELTRSEILRAARRLFAERGFTRTSVRDIAGAAGVSAQTVYDSIGSKQAIVARLNDLIDAEAGVGAIAGPVMSSGDPVQIAVASARITRSMLEHCGDIIRAVVTGAAAEPEIQSVLDEGHRRHVKGAHSVVGLLESLGALARPGDAAATAETLAAITDFRFALLLRESYGWSLDRIEAWMTDASRTLLLG
jgi:AcrR family transcriptional regulator